MSYMQNTLAYKTIKFKYEQYTLNAVQAGGTAYVLRFMA